MHRIIMLTTVGFASVERLVSTHAVPKKQRVQRQTAVISDSFFNAGMEHGVSLGKEREVTHAFLHCIVLVFW
jgi:hypothetical protein